MNRGIAHVAIYTNEFDKTIAFYEEALGARKIGHPNTPRRGVLMNIGEDTVEIFESEKADDGVIKHFAIECDDAEESYAKAIACGATSYMEPKNIIISLINEQGEIVDCPARVAFVKGIAGEQIEFLKYEGGFLL